MINKKKLLKIKQIKKSKSICEKLNLIENLFSNDTAVVFSCGPSFANYEIVLKKYPNALIVCVKDSYDYIGDTCDIHFINSVNLKKYKHNSNQLSVYTYDNVIFDKYDFIFKIIDKYDPTFKNTVCYKRNFHNYSIKNSGVIRPRGPGLMHETVFYFLAHLGVKKIVTLGWDIANDVGINTHFNDKKTNLIKKQNFLIKLFPLVRPIARSFINLYRFFLFKLGIKIFITSSNKNEAFVVSSSEDEFQNYLKSLGIKIDVYSESNWHKLKKNINLLGK